MADEPNAQVIADSQQGVTPGSGNDDVNKGGDNIAPSAPSNEAPKPTEAEVKAAADKVIADKVEADKVAEAAKSDEVKAKEAADAEKAKDNTPLDQDTWGTTGDDVGDSVLTMLQNADVSVDEAKALLFDAVKQGDVTKIDVAALEAKVGKTKATLLMAGITTFVNSQATRNAQIVADIKEASGGEENWTKMTDWSKAQNADGKQNIDEASLTEYRGMIDKGGAMARFAVSEIAAKYNADKGNSTLQTATVATTVIGDGGPGPSARSTSRAVYVEELTKAHRLGASDDALAEITAARHRGRAAGI